jgi:hypothetical protein
MSPGHPVALVPAERLSESEELTSIDPSLVVYVLVKTHIKQRQIQYVCVLDGKRYRRCSRRGRSCRCQRREIKWASDVNESDERTELSPVWQQPECQLRPGILSLGC